MRRALRLFNLKLVRLEVLAAAIAAAFLLAGRVTAQAAWKAVDGGLLLILFALLVTVEILRASGYLEVAVRTTMGRFRSTRAFGLALVLLSGALSALVTNDVTLFVVIPFTVIASRFSDFDVEDAVILEIGASNLAGCLTPLGNPQNLFIYHRSGWSAAQFVVTMAPFVLWCTAALITAVFLLGPSREMKRAEVPASNLNGSAAIAGVVCFALVLLVVARLLPAWPAAVAAAVAGLAFLRRRLLRVDFSIIPLFFFAFVIVEGMRSFAFELRGSLYFSSIALSQAISNVPAAILLTPFAGGEWRELLYGVNAGGCGTIIASLANLLGWRIYVRESNRDPRFFRRLTWINVAFLAWATAGGWLLLKAQ